MNFGERLRRLRGARTQREMAEACGMPQTTYAALESQQWLPKPDVLEKVTRGFGVHPGYFRDEVPTPDASSRAAVMNYVQGLRTDGRKYKMGGIGHTREPDPRREAEQIKRILRKPVAPVEELE